MRPYLIALASQLCLNVMAVGAPLPDPRSDEQRYEDVIADEKRHLGDEHSQEFIASGAAAIVLGLYGYYNTDPNPLIKVMYAATQTAGVLTIGQAVREKNTPRLALDIDDLIKSSPDGQKVSIEELKERIGRFKKNSDTAETQTRIYTSSILAGLYFYNGYREHGPDMTLRNVYYFLGFNFAISAGISTYRIYYPESTDQRLTWYLLPYPTLAYSF